MQKVKIITDSSCDLDISYLDELNVHMCPLVTIFSDGEFLDRVEMSPEEFYKKLESTKDLPKTSQVTPTLFLEAFKKALEEDMEVLCLAFSSKLSGTYQSAVLAKEMLDNSEKIHIIDTLSASVGQGLIVEKAALMAKENKNVNEITQEVFNMISKIKHLIGVGSLDMLKRGGRISSSKAIVGNLLGVRPILNVEKGEIFPLDKARGRKGLIKKLIEILEESGEDIQNTRIGISYSKEIEIAKELEGELNKKGINNILISEIGAVIGSHVGPSTIALFFVGK